MVTSTKNRLIDWIKKEMVLCIAFLCALISAFLVPPSGEYLDYIDFRVLCLLFCLMAVVAGLQKCGVFAVLAQKLLGGEKKIRFLLLILVLLPFFSSMAITNDVALITFVPFAILILTLIGRENYLIHVIVLQTIGANLGSMATPVGNPQNLFLYAKYNLSAGNFFGLLLPLTLLSLFLLVAAAVCCKNETISVHFSGEEQLAAPSRLLAYLALFLLCLLSVFRILPYQILTGCIIAALLLMDRQLFKQVDYSLLLTFVCFFIFAGNMGKLEEIRSLLAKMLEQGALFPSICASQIISNVPAAVLLSSFTNDWKGLLLGTNIGGLGTPIASLASLISLKLYMKYPGAKPMQYLFYFLGANLLGLIILIPFSLFLQ